MPKAESPLTRLSAFFFRHRWLKLVLLLAVPLAWLVGVYLASLGSLLVQSFWRADELSPNPVHVWNLDNYRAFLTGDSVYRSIVARTLGFAAITTLVDIVLAFPLAYYLTRVAVAAHAAHRARAGHRAAVLEPDRAALQRAPDPRRRRHPARRAREVRAERADRLHASSRWRSRSPTSGCRS